MTTQDEIIKFLFQYPDSAPSEIAAGVFLATGTVRDLLCGKMKHLVVKTSEWKGATPSRWCACEDVDWCPLCERVRE